VDKGRGGWEDGGRALSYGNPCQETSYVVRRHEMANIWLKRTGANSVQKQHWKVGIKAEEDVLDWVYSQKGEDSG
jgi:hypothetical protein